MARRKCEPVQPCSTVYEQIVGQSRVVALSENEKETMRFSEFRGIFGVSTVKDSFDLGPADTHVILGQDNTKMVFI